MLAHGRLTLLVLTYTRPGKVPSKGRAERRRLENEPVTNFAASVTCQQPLLRWTRVKRWVTPVVNQATPSSSSSSSSSSSTTAESMCQLPKQHPPRQWKHQQLKHSDKIYYMRKGATWMWDFFFSPGQSHSFPPLSRITRTPSASRRPQRSRNEIPKVVKHDKQLSRPGAGLIIIGCEFERISRIGRRRSFARSLCLVSADKSRFARQLENTIAAATSILHFHLLLTLLLLLLQRSLFSPIASPYSLLFRGKQQSTHTHTHLVCVVRDKQEQQQQQQQPLMFPNHQTGHSPLCIDSRLPAALWLAYTNKTGARNKDVVL